jgi:hypothetical protein
MSASGLVYLFVLAYGMRAIYRDLGMAALMMAAGGCAIALLCLAALVDMRAGRLPSRRQSRSDWQERL